ncbi:MAG: dihydroorotate dehydrogenase electron transfer subunit [Candidatus Desulfofervidaceae bacterium]|nr:dihydroorotate dehydrogenase electron transfer subunit [Candidatus Desulfofervidaceae bacterium]
MFLETAKVVEHCHFIEPGAEIFHLLTLSAPKIASSAKPGQFVMVRVGAAILDPLLRRPFSIFYQGKDTISLLYKVIGKGTNLMTTWEPGDKISVLGPLGKGFKIFSSEPQWLVAGGAGIAPLCFLGSRLREKKVSFKTLWGLRYKIAPALMGVIQQKLGDLIIYTENGSLGYQGLVTEGVKRLRQEEKPEGIYACGPLPMLKALFRWTKEEGIAMQVSLEANMACGVGACLGCVIETKEGYKKVCRQGPVFNAEEIKWEK